MGLADPTDTEAYDRLLDEVIVGGAQPLTAPIEIHEYDPEWPALYAREEERIRAVLGERVVRIEHAGSTREPDWYEHRLFKGPDTNINLHVFTDGCEEAETMLRFRDHLRRDAADRELYAAAKRELAAKDWKYVQQYADAKTAVVREIVERAGDRHLTQGETNGS